MATKIGVRLSGRFSPGQEVLLYARYGDQFDVATAGTKLARAKVNAKGLVAFDGLELGKRYWIAAQDDDGAWRAVAMTAKVQAAPPERLDDNEIAACLAHTRPPASASQATEPITGARSTSSARPTNAAGQAFANPAVGLPTPKELRREVPAPYARIEDVPEGTPLRSHTITGEAHPVNPDLPDGKLRQDQVPEGTPQASCTPLGEATIVGDEDQALARLEQKVPTSQASPQPDELPKREAASKKAAARRRTSAPAPRRAGIEAAKSGKTPQPAKRAAKGKTPTTGRSTGQRARKASPKK